MSSTSSPVRHTGTVLWFNMDKGYGFITPSRPIPNHTGDVFLHINQCGEGWEPTEGEKVTFVVGIRKGKTQAEDARTV